MQTPADVIKVARFSVNIEGTPRDLYVVRANLRPGADPSDELRELAIAATEVEGTYDGHFAEDTFLTRARGRCCLVAATSPDINKLTVLGYAEVDSPDDDRYLSLHALSVRREASVSMRTHALGALVGAALELFPLSSIDEERAVDASEAGKKKAKESEVHVRVTKMTPAGYHAMTEQLGFSRLGEFDRTVNPDAKTIRGSRASIVKHLGFLGPNLLQIPA